LRGDDELVAVGTQVLAQQPAEVRLGRSGRRAVVVGQVEVRDAEVEGPADDVALVAEGDVVTEVVPKSQRQGRKEGAGSADRAVGHRVVAVLGGLVHTFSWAGRGMAVVSAWYESLSAWYESLTRHRGRPSPPPRRPVRCPCPRGRGRVRSRPLCGGGAAGCRREGG